ncbi:endolytic transglycosylase MltG [Flavipsychrobacter stenotrophus]|uniref:Endolytic murein transglycosylase n=1 Tax=Flavipsychrobacter stenotrophus TaxID=2077091 RepID=A0A2S7SWN6_9BACT|nr:endolytic transglycosylase MltG [Flavipsychrobacter stenotrophus]PQJ11021.1 endolytic transglycosylase MltG [Flavipsychrobacter stenotrophus]
MSAKKKKKSRLPLIITIVVIVLLLGAAYKILGPNSGKAQFLYIRTGITYEQLLTQMKDGGYVNDINSFDFLAKRAGLPEHIHPGKYQMKWGMTNYELVKKLRNGRQVPVKLVINKLRTKADFIRLVSTNLEIDSLQLGALMRDKDFLDKMGLDSNTVMCGVRPDTYEFYWNTTTDKLFKKLKESYSRFWTDARREQAKNHGLNPVKATIMASIIDEETNLPADKLNIASVYLNRMDKGMKLQADPTVKFSIGDFTIKRVTGAMLKTESPYNTYQNVGLPPGPICTPSNGSIDAVLNAPQTTYIYFCAKADLSGASVFATTDAEHLLNARLYQQALNARGIH